MRFDPEGSGARPIANPLLLLLLLEPIHIVLANLHTIEVAHNTPDTATRRTLGRRRRGHHRQTVSILVGHDRVLLEHRLRRQVGEQLIVRVVLNDLPRGRINVLALDDALRDHLCKN